MVSKKDRRRSGYVTPKATISKKELIQNDLFLEPYYDDWCDIRDGFRDWFSDFKTIKKIYPRMVKHCSFVEKRIQMNKKQKKLLKRRKRRKQVLQFKGGRNN